MTEHDGYDGDDGHEAHHAEPEAAHAEPEFTEPDPGPGPDLFGRPDADTAEATAAPEDIARWHEQQAHDTCAVVGQEFLIDRFTGVDHTEEELVAVAEAEGWYRPGGGTPIDDVGNLLEHYGVPVERSEGETLDGLASALSDGAGVLVAVDGDEILAADPESQQLADRMGVPDQGADHVVQVIGIDRDDPDHPQVILNDPGRPDGAGLEAPEREFLAAWEDSGRFTVTAGGSRHA
ncbi:hypothetical protein ABZ953_33385 [Streptomyces sp. NPDC046465]|uniref:hypothetical protein n=1 Tax=Streptomyces sp. NPDC046465 TaxID=3155810 RepID=UPI003404DFF5